jgi:hypothetical protein
VSANKEAVIDLVKTMGQPYSEMLGIELKTGESPEIAKWFLASILYAKPIRENSATKTYKIFERERRVTPEAIVGTTRERLVEMLDEGGYTRYDFSTADKLLDVFANLLKNYNGDLNKLYASATDNKDLEGKLKNLGKGIGDVTVGIFLRDMRDTWKRADPDSTVQVKHAARKLGIKDLKVFARKNRLSLVRLETALFRYAKNKHLALGIKKK